MCLGIASISQALINDPVPPITRLGRYLVDYARPERCKLWTHLVRSSLLSK